VMTNSSSFSLEMSWAGLLCIDPNTNVVLALKYSPDFDPKNTFSIFDVKRSPISVPDLIPWTRYHFALVQNEGPDIELPKAKTLKTLPVKCESE